MHQLLQRFAVGAIAVRPYEAEDSFDIDRTTRRRE
jgi:hypothetical protein